MDRLPALDKTKISISSMEDTEEEKNYWFSKGALERIEAIELNRRMVYGEDRATSRLQRFLETAHVADTRTLKTWSTCEAIRGIAAPCSELREVFHLWRERIF